MGNGSVVTNTYDNVFSGTGFLLEEMINKAKFFHDTNNPLVCIKTKPQHIVGVFEEVKRARFYVVF